MRVRKKAMLLTVSAILAFVAWRAVAINRYRVEGARLVAAAERLPREYTVGKGRSVTMIVLGDSTAVGVGAGRLEDTLPYRVTLGLGGRVSVENLAVSGARLRDVVLGQLGSLDRRADVVLLSISANDATRGTLPADLRTDLRTILDRLRDLGIPKVVVSTTPNFRTTPALPLLLNHLFERRAAGLTSAIRSVVADYRFVRLADLNGEGTLNEDQYATDGFHPNAAGYRLWASIFLRAMDK